MRSTSVSDGRCSLQRSLMDESPESALTVPSAQASEKVHVLGKTWPCRNQRRGDGVQSRDAGLMKGALPAVDQRHQWPGVNQRTHEIRKPWRSNFLAIAAENVSRAESVDGGSELSMTPIKPAKQFRRRAIASKAVAIMNPRSDPLGYR